MALRSRGLCGGGVECHLQPVPRAPNLSVTLPRECGQAASPPFSSENTSFPGPELGIQQAATMLPGLGTKSPGFRLRTEPQSPGTEPELPLFTPAAPLRQAGCEASPLPSEWTPCCLVLSPLLRQGRPQGAHRPFPFPQGCSPCPQEDSEANSPSFHPGLPVGARPCLPPAPQDPARGCIPLWGCPQAAGAEPAGDGALEASSPRSGRSGRGSWASPCWALRSHWGRRAR